MAKNTGLPAPPKMNLRQGWNLVSVSNNLGLLDIEAKLQEHIGASIWSWQDKKFLTVSELLSSKGYWIYAKQTVEIEDLRKTNS